MPAIKVWGGSWRQGDNHLCGTNTRVRKLVSASSCTGPTKWTKMCLSSRTYGLLATQPPLLLYTCQSFPAELIWESSSRDFPAEVDNWQDIEISKIYSSFLASLAITKARPSDVRQTPNIPTWLWDSLYWNNSEVNSSPHALPQQTPNMMRLFKYQETAKSLNLKSKPHEWQLSLLHPTHPSPFHWPSSCLILLLYLRESQENHFSTWLNTIYVC
jgi:hypothetical protein